MYKYLLVFLVLAISSIILSQARSPVKSKGETTYKISAEVMPEPIGGIAGIQSNVVYPDSAKKLDISGKVYVLAYINELGVVDKTEIIKGLGHGLDEAATNAVLHTKFTPAKQFGKPVKIKVSIPIEFKLN